MKIVLTEDVKNLGKKDEVHDVKPGYARNYLIPRGLAVEADAQALSEVKAKEEAREHELEQEKTEAQMVADQLTDHTVTVHAKAGESGRLFGAVTSQDIAKALSKDGIHVDRRKMVIEEDIKTFGEYSIDVRLGHGINATFTVVVEE